MEDKNQALISVCIPTYNCARFIREAVESVYLQSYENIEIIVVDDGSTDNTHEIVAELQVKYGNTLKYFYKPNEGLYPSRNYCLEKASGNYIAWLDADDYWLLGKLHAQMEYMQTHPDCLIVFVQWKNFLDREDLINDPLVQYEIGLEKTLKHYLAASLAKKELYEICGKFNTELVVGGDSEMCTRILTREIDINHRIENVYYCRRLHGNNITFTLKHGKNSERNTLSYMISNLRKNIAKKSKFDE
jgi:glycosyltransferase involved in cell wall biosynthesis